MIYGCAPFTAVGSCQWKITEIGFVNGFTSTLPSKTRIKYIYIYYIHVHIYIYIYYTCTLYIYRAHIISMYIYIYTNIYISEQQYGMRSGCVWKCDSYIAINNRNSMGFSWIVEISWEIYCSIPPEWQCLWRKNDDKQWFVGVYNII